MQRRHIALIAGLLVAIAVTGATWWWLSRGKVVAPPPPVAEAPAPLPAPEPASAPLADAGPKHPIEPLAEAPAPAPLPALDQSDGMVQSALAELVGRPGVLAFLNVDGFVRRTVVTVDNLARPMAASRLWPVQPTPGKLQRLIAGDAELIGPDNAARYEPFVAFVASVPPAQAAALYRRLYPLFQQAYAELGYPKGHFNDRLVEVVDHLIAAPEPKRPPAVKLVDVKGEVPSTRPWVRYEYVDEQLESLSSGQKIMVRVGTTHAQRLKGWLSAFRQAIVSPR
ncbi:DUF3014 domain-containing protein [uncultured Piscinibacter sp.]|uniref:DUF3014 domain-containing protein n=1 Tax=uncultured Piscinibacter sp. TaxID=1131835 RepID=UPI00260856F6|nr:DUF3014 domain-containing protein [uncultured Piscinibacter sp.]